MCTYIYKKRVRLQTQCGDHDVRRANGVTQDVEKPQKLYHDTDGLYLYYHPHVIGWSKSGFVGVIKEMMKEMSYGE